MSQADKAIKQVKDSKSTLQELLQKNSKETASYSIVSESGPAHKRRFIAQASHKGKVLGKGEGRSKKEAEQKAAEAALDFMKKEAS